MMKTLINKLNELEEVKMLGTKEFEEIIFYFEKSHKYENLTKEGREFWIKKRVYVNNDTNNMFQGFLKGYAYAKGIYQ